MLQNIRDYVQSWVAYIIIAILVCAFGLWGIERFSGHSRVNPVIAKINGDEITQEELNATYQRLNRQQELKLGQSGIETETDLKNQALEQLIHAYVLKKAAQKEGYRILPEQINYVLTTTPAFQVDGKFSLQRFQQALNMLFYNETTFLMQLSADMLQNQIEMGVVSSAFALPQEVNRAYQLINQTRDISYILIPPSQFKAVASSNPINPKDAEQYYQSHPQQFLIPEQVSIEYVELKLPAIKNQLKLSETELKDYFDNNPANFTRPKEWQIAQILIRLSDNDKTAETKLKQIEERLKLGESFTELAKIYSDDVATKNQGGVLPWVTLPELESDQAQIISALKINEISKPFKTKYGYLIIKLLNEKKSRLKPYTEVKSQIEEILTTQKALEIFNEKTDKLANLSYANPESLAYTANELGLPIQSTDFFSRQGGNTALTQHPKIIAVAFHSDLRSTGNNSNVIPIDDETQIVLRIKSYQAAAIKPYAQIKTDIIRLLADQEASKAAERMAQKIILEHQNGQNLQQLADKYKLSLKKIQHLKRADTLMDAPLVEQAFKTSAIQSIKLPNQVYAVIVVDKINDNPLPPNAYESYTYQKQLAQQYGELDYLLYVDQHIKKAKVKIIKK